MLIVVNILLISRFGHIGHSVEKAYLSERIKKIISIDISIYRYICILCHVPTFLHCPCLDNSNIDRFRCQGSIIRTPGTSHLLLKVPSMKNKEKVSAFTMNDMTQAILIGVKTNGILWNVWELAQKRIVGKWECIWEVMKSIVSTSLSTHLSVSFATGRIVATLH